MISSVIIRGAMTTLTLELAREFAGDRSPDLDDMFTVLRMPVAPAAILSDLCRMLEIQPFSFAEIALGEGDV